MTDTDTQHLRDLQRQFFNDGKHALDMAGYCKHILDHIAAMDIHDIPTPVLPETPHFTQALHRHRKRFTVSTA